MRRRTLLAGLAAAPLVAGAARAGDRPGDPPFQGRSPALGASGMAATAHPLASQAAVAILRAGGSAVDAAIAANAMLGLVEPTGCGIGGDLFALVWDPGAKRLVGLDASGFAARGLDAAALRRRHGAAGAIDPLGMDAVTVPGAVAGWGALHARFGRLPPADLLAPASPLPTSPSPSTRRADRLPVSARPSPTRTSPRPTTCSPATAGRPSTAGPSPRISRPISAPMAARCAPPTLRRCGPNG